MAQSSQTMPTSAPNNSAIFFAATKAASSSPFNLTIRTTDIEPTPAPPPSPIDFGYESSASIDSFTGRWKSKNGSVGATPVSAS